MKTRIGVLVSLAVIQLITAASLQAQELKLHRLTDGAAVKTHDITIFRAIVRDWDEAALNSTEAMGLSVTWLGLVDETKTDGRLIGEIGDSDASVLVSS